jgi:hypothetical protein
MFLVDLFDRSLTKLNASISLPADPGMSTKNDKHGMFTM